MPIKLPPLLTCKLPESLLAKGVRHSLIYRCEFRKTSVAESVGFGRHKSIVSLDWPEFSLGAAEPNAGESGYLAEAT